MTESFSFITSLPFGMIASLSRMIPAIKVSDFSFNSFKGMFKSFLFSLAINSIASTLLLINL